MMGLTGVMLLKGLTGLLSYGENTMGKGYVALWGFGAKYLTGCSEVEWRLL